APEVLKELDHGKPVDMWAIGVITYFLLCGNIPFGDGELMAIIQADYRFEPQECWERISERAKDFISKLLNVDPDSRFTAHQALNHSWLCLIKLVIHLVALMLVEFSKKLSILLE
ncbi:18458_t:CDS:2, partial [Dentiscutata erythropus]